MFDTEELPAHARLEALRAVLVDQTVPSTVEFEPVPPTSMRARVESWQLGDAQVVKARTSHGMDLVRTPRQVRRACVPMVSIAVAVTPAYQEQFGLRHTVSRGALACIDLSAPYSFRQPVNHIGYALQIPLDRLDLPSAVIQRAAPHLTRSPLYDLMSAHLTAVTRDPGQYGEAEVAAGVGRSSIELVRALLLSAAGEHQPRADGSALLAQVRAYVAQHLPDPGLGPDAIAAALNVSVRHLYDVCSRAGFSVEQWIIDRRLEAARRDLTDPAYAGRPISAIARRRGFRSPAHFTRRFKAAYGVTPSEWRS
ncbi:helix-turn-helix domain-containing protein [Actinoplanes sp. TRM 88003]|uniref:Helix-turn-helix domain-containing protein n=1 Tax=Paractinoplanes aksuensis TaxID=2939490 RepID=A0ABT1DIN5_9ACTN|nr:helix-turn-helix domain-containing protein [Actinoplanes aksuensis]MCO8270358.1 helix-turn-helix domain-containing protein [Actinoplanes aksuensis]